MAFRPNPQTYRCPKCSWTKTVWPKSDVVTPQYDFYDFCPKCRNFHLIVCPATRLELKLEEIKSIFWGIG